MKSRQVYEELKDLAEKLGITVSEQSFKQTAIRVKSGLCKIRGKEMFIMDKHASIHKKNRLLIECLSQRSHEEVFVVPTVREMLTTQSPKIRSKENDPNKS